MKNTIFILFALLMFSCSEEEFLDPTIFNEELSVIENLNNGVSALDISNQLGSDALYGLSYGGGYIYYIDPTNGDLFVAADYSNIGTKSWGDHFDLTNGEFIGDGAANTQQIVDGNLNDNTNVMNGFEFGSDDYAFKIVYDLEYENYDDWFIPSSKSAEKIFNTLHINGIGGFDESKFYWTSTKVGYEPYVMSFNSNFGGEVFLGSCFNSNAIIIVRKING